MGYSACNSSEFGGLLPFSAWSQDRKQLLGSSLASRSVFFLSLSCPQVVLRSQSR